jgi:hypothetical protein
MKPKKEIINNSAACCLDIKGTLNEFPVLSDTNCLDSFRPILEYLKENKLPVILMFNVVNNSQTITDSCIVKSNIIAGDDNKSIT